MVFQGVDGGVWLEHMLTACPAARGFLIFINLFIFFLAFFLDFFEIAFIILPMLGPVAEKMLAPFDLDALIWFGVLLCVNMQTSFMHPPFGFALFYLRGVAPKEVKSSDIYWGALPWIGLQLMMVAIVIAFPVMVTGLLEKPLNVDLSKVKIEVPLTDLPPLDSGQPKKYWSLELKRIGKIPELSHRVCVVLFAVTLLAQKKKPRNRFRGLLLVSPRVTRHVIVVADFGDLAHR